MNFCSNYTNSNFSTNLNSKNEVSGSIPWYLYFNTVISFLGIIANIICSLIFLNQKLTDQAYRFMLIISVSSIFYLSFSSFYIIVDCRDNCKVSKTFTANLFEMYIKEYFTSCLAFFIVLIEILLSVKRFLILSCSFRHKTISIKYLPFICLGFSFLLYSPELFIKKIIQVENGYTLCKTNFGKSKSGSYYPIVVSFLRVFLATVFLSILNILTALKFKLQMNKKKKIFLTSNINKTISNFLECILSYHIFSKNSSYQYFLGIQNQISTSVNSNVNIYNNNSSLHIVTSINTEERANRSITLLVFWMSIFFTIGHGPYAIFIILKNFNDDEESDLYDYINDAFLFSLHRVALSTLVIIHSSNIFIYYFFNKLFQSIFKAYLKKIFNVI